eukprot:2664343-Prorocentrum_lima.AAC.1
MPSKADKVLSRQRLRLVQRKPPISLSPPMRPHRSPGVPVPRKGEGGRATRTGEIAPPRLGK